MAAVSRWRVESLQADQEVVRRSFSGRSETSHVASYCLQSCDMCTCGSCVSLCAHFSVLCGGFKCESGGGSLHLVFSALKAHVLLATEDVVV